LVVLEAGRVVQFDRAAVVRRSPATLLAALATGPMALLDMRVVADGGGYWLVRDDSDGEAVRLRAWTPALAGCVGAAVRVGVRPEDVVVVDTGSIPAVVERSAVLHPGGVICQVAGQRVTATVLSGQAYAPGDHVRLRVDHHTAFDPRNDRSIR
jgi:ABC-type sugar transport system ATPase subunit